MQEEVYFMKHRYLLYIVLLLISIVPVTQAMAYVDPGTGRALYSMFAPLVAVILSFLGVLAIFFRRILSFFKRLFTRTSR